MRISAYWAIVGLSRAASSRTRSLPGTPTITGDNGSVYGFVTNAGATLTLSNFTVSGSPPAGANKKFTIVRIGTGAANNFWEWKVS